MTSSCPWEPPRSFAVFSPSPLAVQENTFLPRASTLPTSPCLIPRVLFSFVPLNLSLVCLLQTGHPFLVYSICFLKVSEYHWIHDSILDIRWEITEIMFLKMESLSSKTHSFSCLKQAVVYLSSGCGSKKKIFSQIHFLNANFVSCWVMSVCNIVSTCLFCGQNQTSILSWAWAWNTCANQAG